MRKEAGAAEDNSLALSAKAQQQQAFLSTYKGLRNIRVDQGNRENTCSRQAVEQMTNIQVPVCTMLELDDKGQLHMNRHNKNAFDYQDLDVQKATEYAKFKKVPTHSLDV